MPASVIVGTAVTNHTFGLLLTELHKKIKSLSGVREACYNLQRNLKIFSAYMDDEIRRDARTNMDRARSEVVRELVFDVEDCIESYMYRIMCLDDAKGLAWIRGTVKTLSIRNEFAKQIKKLNHRVQQAGLDQIKIGSITAEVNAPAGGDDQIRRTIQENPVGFAQAKKEILMLLDEVENEPRKLRVIAVVGFGGSGKTTLVSAVYQSILPADDDAEAKSKLTRFPLHAWVDRRHYKDAPSLLKRIILEFWPEEGKTAAESSDRQTLRRYIQNRIKNERYLIILDEMDMRLWELIDITFKDKGISSRIIVTTCWLPAAYLCSSNSYKRSHGYVYKMRSVCNEDSQILAHLKEIAHDSCPCHQGQCQCPLETLQKKCDGLPLALVSSANHLESTRMGDPTIEDCETLCNELGSLLHKNTDNVAAKAMAQLETFEDLRGVLKNNYASLADGTLGACCLLYLGISPDARCLKKNKITRRWLAEGYAPSQQEQADKIFKKLINLNIIQPVGICTSPTCKVLGVVHEFVLHKAMMENFVKTIDLAEQSSASTGEKKQKSRHFFVRGGNITSSRATLGMDLTHVRSLTVVTARNKSNNVRSGCAEQEDVEGNNVSASAVHDNGADHGSGSACGGFFKFSKYRSLRVLDLEECTEINNGHLASICCDLWNLRYLSLGHKVNKLPNEIKQLELLERLQLSKTKVTELPVGIIGMPFLKHLIGRFVLLGPEPSDKMVENSKLETLSGIVVDPKQGFLPLVPRLKNLMKVNMCFDQSSGIMFDLGNLLLDAIKGYLQRRLGHGFSRSLSIDFESLYRINYDRYQQQAMEQLHDMMMSSDPQMKHYPQYYLTSLKLHGRSLSPWPQFVALLSGLTKLSLSSLKSVTQDLLSAISNLRHSLKHLKLMADEISQDLVIRNGTFFASLETLCFVVRGPNGIPKIKIEGNMPALRYLQLISKVLAPELCGINIRNFTRLEEIELHAEVSTEAWQKWETAAMTDHPNRPDVLPLRSVRDPTREEARAVPATTSGNTLDQEPAVHPVAVGVETPAESPIITATETSHEPTLIPFAYSSTPGNHHEPQYLADSVASAATEDAVTSPKLVAEKRLGMTTVQNTSFANNHGPNAERDKPLEKPIAVDEEAPDTSNSPTAQPVDEASNHAPVNNASNGVHGVDANGHGQDH